MFVQRNSSSKSLNTQKNKLSKEFVNDSTNNFLSLPKQNKNIICLSPHSINNNSKFLYPPAFNIMPANTNNIQMMQKNMIHEKMEKFRLHPFRRLNLKLIGEDIKQKLMEMNEENGFENAKTISSPTDKRQFSRILKKNYNLNESFINLNFSYTNERNLKGNSASAIQKPISDFFEKNSEIKEKEVKVAGSHIINLKIPKLKIKKDNQNNEDENSKNSMIKKSVKSINTKLASKYRKLKKIKNLYDSMDDNESDEKIGEGIINPETKFILIFDLIIIILYIYTFFVTTINILKTECFCHSQIGSFNDIIFFFNDLVYIVDLIISFFRGYYNFEYKLIKINKFILKNYLTGDFILDFLEAIPFFSINKYICWNNSNYFYCYNYEIPSIFFILKVALILKVLKIIKILGRKKNQALDNFLELISENYTVERTILLAIDSSIFIGIFHCFVCFHIFIGKHTYSNWILKTNAENESLFDLYIESLYFLITTLTTVGYGDIVCNSFGERIFHILLLAVGSIFYSYIISTVGNYIKNDSHAKIAFNNDLNILENIRIAYPNMPFKLYKNIYKYLESKSSSQEKYDVNSLIDALPFTLKNTILFTMYKSVIKNFKFFKKNDNSEFIAEVLTNFIPLISKKNEFLVYEGEMLEEIIFIKDGRISLNAAINLEDPSDSINKYFNEKFIKFTSDEEKKLFGSHIYDINNLNKSVYVSTMNGEITYDTAKTKINNAFNNIKSMKTIDDKSLLAINNNIEKPDINDLIKFDVNGGAIKNEDGTYQYLKIMDIRKNEHFGCVFMTLRIPCPLSLQVKSKFSEVFLYKKEQAIATSKSYPNIWKRLYGKEFHNMRSIKNLTFKVLKKYIELNQLLLDLNLDDAIAKNDLTINDINELEKSILTDKSLAMNPLFQHSKKNITQKKHLPSNNLTKFRTMNSDFDKKQKKRLSLGGIYVQSQKDKISSLKNKFKKGNQLSNSIIYVNPNKDKFLKLGSFGSNSPFLSNKKPKPKLVHFADDIVFSKSSKNEIENSNNILSMKKISSTDSLYSDENDSEKKLKINQKNQKKMEQIKKLKKFLIKYKQKLKIRQYKELESKKNIPKEDNKDLSINNNIHIKKPCLKMKTSNQIKPDLKYQINLITQSKIIENINTVESSNNKNNVEISSNKLKLNECDNSIIKDLDNFCNEENNFSFLSVEHFYNFLDLSISNDINFEIISSYENINQISKGNYIYDYKTQNKFKLKLKKYYMKESTISLNYFKLSSSDSSGDIKIKQKKTKKTRKSPISSKKNMKKSKKKFRHDYPKSNKIKRKLDKESKIKHNEKKHEYETDIKNKNQKKKKNYSSKGINERHKITFMNANTNYSTNQNNFTFYPTSENININEQNSIKVNASSNENNSSSYSKKETKKMSQNNSLDIDIKKNMHIYNQSETEFEINKTFTKANIIYKNNYLSNKNSNKNISILNYKKKNGSSKNKKSKETKIINQILGIQLPSTNIITNNITSSNNMDNNKDHFKSSEKINNIEASFSIYNIIQKNINKNLNIIDSKENIKQNNMNKSICFIY